MSEIVYGIHAVRAILSSDADNIREALVQKQIRNAQVQDILGELKKRNIRFSFLDKRQLDERCDGNHQGIAIVYGASERSISEQELPALLADLKEPAFILILDGIQDPHNLGACLRTANAAGVQVVIAPKNNSVGITATVRKVACGAAESTPFVQVTNLSRTMEWLREQGIWITGTDAATEKNVFEGDYIGPVAIVIGSEGSGLRRLTREYCDFLVNIPMSGQVESLNASVATAICLYEVRRQRLARA
ncbi:MAG: 23S rRNA (guanosine(2251)-2'-O)-methyltransferase RlmB [Gammaproteobacteria bacterium]|nr:23S rRNA (guanosine(2251)-2'-O)-methyltransferase RlmB [Gammaproteobacteria bacterium]